MSPSWQKIKSGALYGVGFSLVVLAILALAYLWFSSSIRFYSKEDDPLGGKHVYEFSVEERVKLATAIALVKVEVIDGKVQCKFTEILKLSPDVIFNHKVGSTFSHCKSYASGELSTGDVLLLYFYDDPADVRLVVPIRKDGSSMGSISVSALRELIKSQSEISKANP